MIRFSLRLVLAGGREAAARLALIAAAVAVGVGLLLAILAGVNAVNTQNARYAWLNTGGGSSLATTSAHDPLWWAVRRDYFEGQTIGRVDVAATGPQSPIPPGLTHLPGPGEFYASPALAKLIQSTPADELGNRFRGRDVGTIGPAALPSPDSLIIIIGHRPQELAHTADAKPVTSIMNLARNDCGANCYVGIDAAGIDLILAVVAAGLLFPVLILIGVGTRLAAARREQRFAAMRLVGATPGQITVMSTVESTVAAIAGTMIGFGLFFASRHALAGIPFTGTPFFPSDLSLGVVDVVLVAIGIPSAATVAAWLALRRVQISPLGVTRRVTTRAPRAWRVIPLAMGIAELVYFVGRRPPTTNGQVAAYLSGILMIMVGLVVAGPWLTMLSATAMAGRASRPAALIAARRLADNPQAAFRSVSGLMLALFVTSVASGVITTVTAHDASPSGSQARTVLSKTFWGALGSGQSAPRDTAVPPTLQSIPGVHSVTVVYANPHGHPGPSGPYVEPGLVRCADLVGTPAFGNCPAGAAVAAGSAVDLSFSARQLESGHRPAWQASDVRPAQLHRLPILSIVVDTNGSKMTLERARTVLDAAFPFGEPPSTDADFASDSANLLVEFQQLANVVILFSIPVAGCSLAVAVAGGLADRKRPFSLLRLTGARFATLRRVITLESVVPLLVVAVVAIGIGFLAAHLFLISQLHYSLKAPGVSYYVTVAAGIAASLGIIASVLPLLKRLTGPETARND